MTTTNVTREQAEAALDAVKTRYCKPISMADHGHDAEHSDYESLAAHLLAEHGFGDYEVKGVTYPGVPVPEDFDHALAKHADDHVEENMWGSEPVLQEPGVQCSGWAIVWEEGPDDWPTQVSSGGSTEEERVLLAEAAEEFGANLTANEPEPVTMPKGVYVEPVSHVTLGVYPA